MWFYQPVLCREIQLTKKSLSTEDHVHTLFIKYSPRIRGFILSILPDMGRADDVLQETFLTASSKANEFVVGTNFVAWACSIARYKVLEECRQTQKAGMLSAEVIEAVCSARSAAFPDNRDDQLGALQECLMSLSPHARRAVELRYARAHSAAEIADLLDWSTESVYVVLSRARCALLKCVSTKLELEN